MPSIVSTPPRVRIRSKTMTSASNQQQSSQSSRPSALRKPNRGRSKERNVVRKSLSTELAEVASQKEASRSRSKKVVSPRKLKKKEKKRQEDKETERKRQEENEKEKVKEKKRQEEKEKVKEKKREEEKEKEKEKKRQEEKQKEKEKKLQEEKEKAKEKKRQEEKEKEKKLQEEKEKEKEKEKKRQEEKQKEKEKKLQEEKEKAKEKKRQEEKEKEKKLQEEKEKEKEKETEKKRHEEKEKEGKKKKKDSAIVFEPAKRSKIEHIFEAPPETSAPSTPLTSKQKAEAQFAKLAAHLEDSDSDSVPATDLEAFAGKVGQVAQGSDEDGEEGSESLSEDESEEAQGEEEKTEVPNQDGEGKDAPSSSEEEGEDSAEEGEEEEECTEDEASSEEEGGENEGGETKKKKTGEGETASHALVPVTDATASQTLALRNSMTHKKEWDSFVRSAKTKMPIGLNDMYLSSKQELFSLWLDHNKDWGACSLEIERRQEQQNVAKRGWQAVQGKVLKSRYSPEKWQHILASRKAAGLFYEDEDFPGDDDDSWLNQVKLCFPIQITAKPSLIVFLRPKPDQVKTQSFKIVSG